MTSAKFFTKKDPEKKLLVALKKKAGRSSAGRITVRHQGGGAKQLYRIVDFGQEKINIPGMVTAIEYDPYRTSFIVLVEYKDGQRSYLLAPKEIKIGDEIICAEETDQRIGNRTKL